MSRLSSFFKILIVTQSQRATSGEVPCPVRGRNSGSPGAGRNPDGKVWRAEEYFLLPSMRESVKILNVLMKK
jgi:hypothetical protein